MKKKETIVALEDSHSIDSYNDLSLSSSGNSKKKIKRIRYLNWVQGRVDFVPAYELEIDEEEVLKKEMGLEKEVQQAMGRLNFLEKKFIQYYYFECLSYEKIAEILNKKQYKLQRIHRRALDKLKIILKDFVRERFQISCDPVQNGSIRKKPEPVESVWPGLNRNCILCQSPFKQEINLLIRGKRKDQTWKPLIKLLEEKYHLKIKTPQILIGHQKNHMV